MDWNRYMGPPILHIDELSLKWAHGLAQHLPREAPIEPKKKGGF